MQRDDVAYTPFYCEENIWHLSLSPGLGDRERWVVFISNPARTCALWSQRASRDRISAVVWDYHVILVAAAPSGGFEVFDLDTIAGFPLSVPFYLKATFPFGDGVPAPVRPRFRVVEAARLRRTFSSNRSHMRTADGKWLRPPPPWPIIQAPGVEMNLPAFLDMENDHFGEVFDLESFRERFGKPHVETPRSEEP